MVCQFVGFSGSLNLFLSNFIVFINKVNAAYTCYYIRFRQAIKAFKGGVVASASQSQERRRGI